MSAFEIMISDAQRDLIVRLMRHAMNTDAPLTSDELEETDMLVQMLSDLKDDDSNYCVDPKDGKRKHILHGLCL